MMNVLSDLGSTEHFYSIAKIFHYHTQIQTPTCKYYVSKGPECNTNLLFVSLKENASTILKLQEL